MNTQNPQWSVYVHINKTNLKMYIGITSTKPSRRWGYEGHGYKMNPKFWHAIQKYGWDGFQHEVLISGINEELACQLEVMLIAKFDTIKNGYNQEPGGIGGAKSDEARQKIREARKRQIITPEHIAKVAASHRGRKNTPETKALMHESARDRFEPVVCIETGERFESITDAAKAKNVPISGVYRSCKRYEDNTPTRNRGLHWRFENTNKAERLPQCG